MNGDALTTNDKQTTMPSTFKVDNVGLKDYLKSRDFSSDILQTDGPLIVKPISSQQFMNSKPRQHLSKIFGRGIS